MSFHDETFKNIVGNVHFKRLAKSHPTAPGFLEMQSSNSSDALLMNFFSHPRIKESKSLRKLLSFKLSDDIEFGWNPKHENETRHKTEIDMKIGMSIFEAKLIESDFKSKTLDVVLRYNDVENLIDLKPLIKNGLVYNYQLIRNAVTAKIYNYKFYLIVDETRVDLILEFNKVKNLIIDKSLKENFSFITWQEIAKYVEIDLKNYVTKKYF